MSERLPDNASEPVKKPEPSSQWLWKNLKPFGCILCLGLMVLVLVLCFTLGRDPVEGYEAPCATEYYAENPEALKTELEENVFPALEGIVSCRVEEGKVAVTIEEDVFAASRGAILRYFDASLLEFIME